MESTTLEQIIRNNVLLPSYPSTLGWYHVLCKVCNDHGRKGNRGGFKFDGDVVSYNCFNCKHKATYDPSKHSSMPSKMKKVLDSFDVPEEEWQQVLFTSLSNKDKLAPSLQTISKPINIEPTELPIPDSFYLLCEATEDDKWAIIAKDYLTYNRNIDPDSYPFMLSKNPSDPRMKKWVGRLIIPIYKDHKLIFYQGRDLVGNKLKKYESPPVSKDKVMYGFDELFKYTEAPLYIVEGWMDAFPINGVAILGNEFSQAQLRWLNRSTRKKVYVPDRFGDGQVAAEQAINEGWYISTPDIGDSKDISDAIAKYGKMYVMKTLADNIAEGFVAQTNLKIYCK